MLVPTPDSIAPDSFWEPLVAKLRAVYHVPNSELIDWDEEQMMAYLRQCPDVERFKGALHARPIQESLVQALTAIAAAFAR